MTLQQQDIDRLQIVDEQIPLVLLPDFSADRTRRKVGRVEFYDIGRGAVPGSVEGAGARTGDDPGAGGAGDAGETGRDRGHLFVRGKESGGGGLEGEC